MTDRCPAGKRWNASRGTCETSHAGRNIAIAVVILALLGVGAYYFLVYNPIVGNRELTIEIFMNPQTKGFNPYNATVYLDGGIIYEKSWSNDTVPDHTSTPRIPDKVITKTTNPNDFRIVLRNKYSHGIYEGGIIKIINETITATYDFSISEGKYIEITFGEFGSQSATQLTALPERI